MLTLRYVPYHVFRFTLFLGGFSFVACAISPDIGIRRIGRRIHRSPIFDISQSWSIYMIRTDVFFVRPLLTTSGWLLVNCRMIIIRFIDS